MLPTCVDSEDVCPLVGIVDDNTGSIGGSFVTGTTCDGGVDAEGVQLTEIPTGTKCQAVCSNNITAQGDIQCIGTELYDISYCISSDSTSSVISTTNIYGQISADAEVAPSDADLEYGFCGALLSSQNCEYVFDVSSTPSAAGGGRLLLDVDEVGSERRLQAVTFLMDYHITIPETATVDPTAVEAAARQFSDPNSTASQKFITSMNTRGVALSNLQETKAPTTTVGVVVVASDGAIVNPNDSPAPSPSSGDGDSNNVGVIVGGVIGGTVGLGLCIACGYYVFVLRRKAEA